MRIIGVSSLTEDQIKEMVREFSELDIPILQLSKKYGIERAGVTYWLKKKGVYIPRKFKTKGSYCLDKVLELNRAGVYTDEIAKAVGMSDGQISKILKSRGLKNHRRPAKDRFNSRKKDIIAEDLIKFYLETKSDKATALKFDCSVSYVDRTLRKNGYSRILAKERAELFESKKEDIIRLYNEGYTLKKIGEIVGLKKHTIEKLLTKWGVERVREAKFKNKLSKYSDKEIIQKYREFRYITLTAKFYSVPVANIAEILKRNGIDTVELFTEEEKASIILEYNQNIPMKDIAKKYNVDYHTITFYLKKWGIKLNGSEWSTLLSRLNITEKDILDKFDEIGTVIGTSLYFNTTCTTIRKTLKKYNRIPWAEEVRLLLESKKEWIISEYNRGISGNDIADTLGVGRDTVYGYLASWGIEMKPCHGYNTSIERKMAEILSGLGIKHRQQFVVQLSRKHNHRYVYDFFLPEFNTIIEAHGDYWHANPEKYADKKLNPIQENSIKKDKKKKEKAESLGYKIIYFWEKQIMKNTESVRKTLKEVFTNNPVSV